LLGRPYWAVYLASLDDACLDEISRDDEFETDALAVAALSEAERTKRLEDRVCRALRRGPWPLRTPQPIESLHVVDDAPVIWWGHPARLEQVENALGGFAQDPVWP
jgi:hypothetical protein